MNNYTNLAIITSTTHHSNTNLAIITTTTTMKNTHLFLNLFFSFTSISISSRTTCNSELNSLPNVEIKIFISSTSEAGASLATLVVDGN